MSLRLRLYEQGPPGGYSYTQTEGIHKAFQSEPLIEAQAQIVAGFRKLNGLPRATTREALLDIDAYTCARLGGMSPFCVDAEASATGALGTASPIVAPPCASCGAPVQ